ncbi:2-amino-3-ketobutyrate coenzyme A ligase [Chromobacterium violaceum]|uniref:2-amino-3-ketobutyrate coenzyme A ligase n=1 Tax=Chromobacterium violaceum TaxID=536 RepID=A0A3S4HL12_CHRVL|nr:2-amino-3-ketobutyrate coenzyme A ligase [Chromobacterium violaceum]
MEVLNILKGGEGAELRAKVRRNAELFRKEMSAAGFTLVPANTRSSGDAGDARLAGEMAAKLLAEGVYVIGFSYPVVPKARRASAPRCPPRTARNK